MKLLEIIQSVDFKSIDNSIADLERRSHKSQLKDTQGFYSRVIDDQNDPHTVKKISKNSTVGIARISGSAQKDPYWQFIEYLITEQIQNPYFPIIRNVKKIKDAYGNKKYIADIEKLVHHRQVPDRFKIMAMERIYGDGYPGQRYIDQYCANADSYIEFLMKTYHRPGKVEVLDSEFTSALQIMKKYEAENDVRVDDHGGNLMWRITPYGAWPVFIDPFSN